jgi:hypothetical protein
MSVKIKAECETHTKAEKTVRRKPQCEAEIARRNTNQVFFVSRAALHDGERGRIAG